MKSASDIVLKLLGILLLTAAVLKGWQLLTEPIVDSYIWTHRPVELVLGIWLLSGRSKKTAWLAALLCFALFSAVPLYKSAAGAVSCGCFGSLYTNPRITLLAVYLPAVIALLVFRPGREKVSARPSILRFTAIFAVGLIPLGIATPVLAFNKPVGVTCSYEVLEPKTWVGKELPILEYIDIAESLKEGNWLVLLYHYDCPDCIETIPKYEQMARDLTNKERTDVLALLQMQVNVASICQDNTLYQPSKTNLSCDSDKYKEDKWYQWVDIINKNIKAITSVEEKIVEYGIIE